MVKLEDEFKIHNVTFKKTKLINYVRYVWLPDKILFYNYMDDKFVVEYVFLLNTDLAWFAVNRLSINSFSDYYKALNQNSQGYNNEFVLDFNNLDDFMPEDKVRKSLLLL